MFSSCGKLVRLSLALAIASWNSFWVSPSSLKRKVDCTWLTVLRKLLSSTFFSASFIFSTAMRSCMRIILSAVFLNCSTTAFKRSRETTSKRRIWKFGINLHLDKNWDQTLSTKFHVAKKNHIRERWMHNNTGFTIGQPLLRIQNFQQKYKMKTI